ncbi:TetR/AcrR family transcriptional regulator [Methylobacterium iners]|uniref:HTH-type transcriptional regulator BetI n=1 Tax=Methylobacterium iners TaxID=418707 RepID=A0ABQ4RUR0_9HYPH|nr:TetR/AcrR family transcriptional regulator C-terminal domain-containing protein [Methylobacterium iners]GJD94301.1 HTH-type transcriptional regulator BetI [Methylobacterium iners]
MSEARPDGASAKRAVGRPRAHEKRQAIIAAAWRLFLTQGVQATALEAVARAAGVSRATLYSHFPDKTALFEATMRDEMDRLAPTQALPAEGVSLHDGLVAFGRGLMRYLASPIPVTFYAVLAGELRRHPDLARRFYELGPGQTHRDLTALLVRAAGRGEIDLPEPEQAAEQLVGLWQGLTNYRLALDLDVDALVAGIDERVERAVALFLAAHRGERVQA